MKNFFQLFQLSVAKLAVATIIFVSIVPFIKVQMFCSIPPCYPGSTTILLALWRGYSPPGIHFSTFLIGIPISYIFASLVLFLSKKDFFVVVGTILLQLGSLFLIQYVHVSPSSTENIIALLCLLILSSIGFWFFGKRKRILVFTLILPLFFVCALLFNINMI